jgi:hypothetical protein
MVSSLRRIPQIEEGLAVAASERRVISFYPDTSNDERMICNKGKFRSSADTRADDTAPKKTCGVFVYSPRL